MRSRLNYFVTALSTFTRINNNLGLQITPNYGGRLTQAEILDRLPGIDFQGPGWYFIANTTGKKIDSILIVADINQRLWTGRLWKKFGWHHKVKFLVYAWVNHDASSTLQLLNQAPVRRDDR